MNEYQYMAMLESIVALTVLLWFIRYPWQRFLIDRTRQRLFEVRDQIFLFAAQGRIDFESPVYEELRERLNFAIRFAHMARFSNFLAFIFASEHTTVKASRAESLAEIIGRLENQDLKADLMKLQDKAARALSILMVFRSPFMLIASLVVGIFMGLANLFGTPASKIKSAIGKLGSDIEKDIYTGGKWA